MRDLASAVVLAAFESTSLNSEELSFFCNYPVAGVTLFRRNIGNNLDVLRDTIGTLQAKTSLEMPMIVAIDQEGGRVSRMPVGFPDEGPPLFIKREQAIARDSLDYIRDYGLRVGRSLTEVGVNVNFAPVLDIMTHAANVAIGDRCWGREPDEVSERAGAFLHGMQEAGVVGCLKHFPGQGDADADTHLQDSFIHRSRRSLYERELVPYMRLLPRSSLVMISHSIYTDFDSKPASLSPVIQQELLKETLSYHGLVLSDDMNMSAIEQDPDKWVAQLEQALLAGTDLLLICRDVSRIRMAVDLLACRARQSVALRSRLKDAKQRVDHFRRSLWLKNAKTDLTRHPPVYPL